MSDRTSDAIDIAADPGTVLDIIADFEAYPEWAEQITEARITVQDDDGWADEVEYTLDAGAIKDSYTLAYDWDVDEDGTGSLSWHLVKATILKALNGTYTLEAIDGGTRVTYELEVDLKIPMIGMIKRKAAKVIIDTALKGLKKRAES